MKHIYRVYQPIDNKLSIQELKDVTLDGLIYESRIDGWIFGIPKQTAEWDGYEGVK